MTMILMSNDFDVNDFDDDVVCFYFVDIFFHVCNHKRMLEIKFTDNRIWAITHVMFLMVNDWM